MLRLLQRSLPLEFTADSFLRAQLKRCVLTESFLDHPGGYVSPLPYFFTTFPMT